MTLDLLHKRAGAGEQNSAKLVDGVEKQKNQNRYWYLAQYDLWMNTRNSEFPNMLFNAVFSDGQNSYCLTDGGP